MIDKELLSKLEEMIEYHQNNYQKSEHDVNQCPIAFLASKLRELEDKMDNQILN